jgi:hypothetical protein
MQVEVESYSGHKADERPVRFRLDGHDYLVEELLDQWYGQSDLFFKVRADDGNLYILSRESSSPAGRWRLSATSFYCMLHLLLLMTDWQPSRFARTILQRTAPKLYQGTSQPLMIPCGFEPPLETS